MDAGSAKDASFYKYGNLRGVALVMWPEENGVGVKLKCWGIENRKTGGR